MSSRTATPQADAASPRAAGTARQRPDWLSARRHSRAELLDLVATMAQELERRAAPRLPRPAGSTALDGDSLACLRAARHLREVISIAEGRKSAAYWRRGRTEGAKALSNPRRRLPARMGLRH